MSYVKGIMSAIAGFFLANFVYSLVVNFRDAIVQQKATGVGAVVGGLVESLFSPVPWILTLFFFAIFFTASLRKSKIVRVVFFWIPTVIISTLGFGLLTLFLYMFIRFRNG